MVAGIPDDLGNPQISNFHVDSLLTVGPSKIAVCACAEPEQTG